MRLAYDEYSPICKELTVLREWDDRLGDVRLCMKTGYQNSSLWDDPTELQRFKDSIPEMVAETEFIAPDKKHWFRITIADGGVFLYFSDDQWHIAHAVERDLDYAFGMVQGEKSYVVDHDSSVRFDQNDFETALINFNGIVSAIKKVIKN